MDTAALKASWGRVAATGDDVPLYFYSHLFLSHPEVRSMFPIQMTAQRETLVAALGAVVSSVDNVDTKVGRVALAPSAAEVAPGFVTNPGMSV